MVIDVAQARATRPTMGEYDLAAAESYLAASLSCDVIMKGGITSGVVYPHAVCRLATRYRLKKLGGASAGAIAAALAVAAEFARTHRADADADAEASVTVDHERSGFVGLHAVPDELGAKLGLLFQPAPATSAAYGLLSTWLRLKPPRRQHATGTWARLAGAVRRAAAAARALAVLWVRLVAAAPLAFLLTLLGALVPLLMSAIGVGGITGDRWPWLTALIAVWLVVSLAAATAAAAWRLLTTTLKAMAANGFGLCDGHTQDPSVSHPPLTDWMAAKIDELAGLHPGPLTFGDLWGREATAKRADLRQRQADGEPVTAEDWRAFTPDVDLRVMTTNLTLRRPYAFPFSDDDIFYFCETCWNGYFPEYVMEFLVEHSGEADEQLPASPGSSTPTVTMRCPQHGTWVRLLPDAAELPVVVAARLSLSFPGLISAVPLLCVDYYRKPSARTLIQTWFSDGGIASNFPMHFFDAPWPRRPTFGINLQPRHPDYEEQWVWRPPNGSSGVVPRSYPLTSMVGFVESMVRTMQNWADATQITLPGYRDRIAEVRTDSDEGGMNLQMPAPIITRLAGRGSQAAGEFEEFDFDLHEWIRYRTAMSSLSEVLDNMEARYPPTLPDDEGYEQFLSRYGPVADEYRHQDAAALEADTAATRELMRLARLWVSAKYPLAAPQIPTPRPRLRQMPPL